MGGTLMQRRRVEEEGIRIVNSCRVGRRMTVPHKKAPANYVPAAAVKRRVRALSGITGCKGSAGGHLSWVSKLRAQPVPALKTE